MDNTTIIMNGIQITGSVILIIMNGIHDNDIDYYLGGIHKLKFIIMTLIPNPTPSPFSVTLFCAYSLDCSKSDSQTFSQMKLALFGY